MTFACSLNWAFHSESMNVKRIMFLLRNKCIEYTNENVFFSESSNLILSIHPCIFIFLLLCRQQRASILDLYFQTGCFLGVHPQHGKGVDSHVRECIRKTGRVQLFQVCASDDVRGAQIVIHFVVDTLVSACACVSPAIFVMLLLLSPVALVVAVVVEKEVVRYTRTSIAVTSQFTIFFSVRIPGCNGGVDVKEVADANGSMFYFCLSLPKAKGTKHLLKFYLAWNPDYFQGRRGYWNWP